MISKFDLAKALRDQAKIVSDANSFVLISDGKTEDGENFTPDVNKSHIIESTLFGDDNHVGLGNDSVVIQYGIYQLSVHSTKIEPKWTGLLIIDILTAHFARELTPSFNGQNVKVIDSSTSPMIMESKTHFIYNLSIRFSVIN